ncbi:hypothetical protein KIN20_028905 [Parelaphostrongylus tenuis]|uniref:Uncharacterized protein n=1 Tax=Parelaphostrongylus tenuis TaxID=148309 RepID=A0AAD5R1G9_PARTN|nr:hypothetical protein KIN20_028905 [Parelaphostrongylus tenuis]
MSCESLGYDIENVSSYVVSAMGSPCQARLPIATREELGTLTHQFPRSPRRMDLLLDDMVWIKRSLCISLAYMNGKVEFR